MLSMYYTRSSPIFQIVFSNFFASFFHFPLKKEFFAKPPFPVRIDRKSDPENDLDSSPEKYAVTDAVRKLQLFDRVSVLRSILPISVSTAQNHMLPERLFGIPSALDQKIFAAEQV